MPTSVCMTNLLSRS